MKKNRYACIIICLLLISASCNKERARTPSPVLQSPVANLRQPAAKHFIGEHFGGGIIYYLDKSGKHGLIAATLDFEEPSAWSFKNRLNRAKDTALGAGATNTLNIYNAQGYPQSEAYSYAALECLELTLNGYQDWYMPSLSELNEMYKNKTIIGGFAPFPYWCSSEVDSTKAWIKKFSNGLLELQPKTSKYAVRPGRRF